MSEERFFLALILFVGIGIGFLAGTIVEEHRWQRQALGHGAATWEVSDDGSTTFKWLNEPKEGAEE